MYLYTINMYTMGVYAYTKIFIHKYIHTQVNLLQHSNIQDEFTLGLYLNYNIIIMYINFDLKMMEIRENISVFKIVNKSKIFQLVGEGT